MVFSSFEFLFVFLPLCMLAYVVIGRLLGGAAGLFTLLVGSLVFYAYWDWRYLFLLIPSILINFAIGRSLARGGGRWVFVLGITFNLALIAVFKYADFLGQTVKHLSGLEIPVFGIVLPLGISFFTFQQIAYLADCRSDRKSEPSLTRYGLFVSFFPQLIAGPIVHHSELLPQLARQDALRGRWGRLDAGLTFLAVGLFKKVAIADTLSPWVAAIFDGDGQLSAEVAWFGALAYTFQLYFDFSGYSDMAIGLGKLFGVDLPDNFDSPYKASSIVDFWRRWHMTLSRFLRDYLYIPLGGNRKGSVRRYVNLFITMLLGGLWHGAAWTFVVWGVLHGILLVINHAWERFGVSLPRPVARAVTLLSVVLGWVVFRATSFGGASDMLMAMAGAAPGAEGDERFSPDGRWYLLGLLLVVTQFAPTTKELATQPLGFGRGLLYGTMFFIAVLLMRETVLGGSRVTEFIYFQF